MDKLRDWLAAVNARQMWTTRVKGIGRIDCYRIGDGIALVQVYSRDRSADGWDLFVPASRENDIAKTFEAAELALRIKS